MSHEYLNLKQVAAELDLSYSTVKGLVQRRQLAYERYAANVIRVRREDLEDFKRQAYFPARRYGGRKPRQRVTTLEKEHERARGRAVSGL